MTSRSDGYIPPCIPTRAYKVPAGPDCVHEIKHDGPRLQVRRDGDVVRLFTRCGYDWSGPLPAIATTAMRCAREAEWWPLERRLVKCKFEPMDLANMRQNGVRSIEVMCHGCRHEVVLNVDQYPGDLLVREFGPRLVCTKCGMVGADVRPNWKERRSGRA
jgi:hypothetical protein